MEHPPYPLHKGEELEIINHRTQRIFTSRQVALIFEYLGEP